jgi:hypothetical protein
MTPQEEANLRAHNNAADRKVAALEGTLLTYMKKTPRTLLHYFFEGGDNFHLTIVGDRPTTEYLDVLDELVKMKRSEIAAISKLEASQ